MSGAFAATRGRGPLPPVDGPPGLGDTAGRGSRRTLRPGQLWADAPASGTRSAGRSEAFCTSGPSDQIRGDVGGGAGAHSLARRSRRVSAALAACARRIIARSPRTRPLTVVADPTQGAHEIGV